MFFLYFHNRRLKEARVQRLEEKVTVLMANIEALQNRLAQFELEVRSELTPNTELQSFFETQTGKMISISTTSVTIIGTVLAVGIDAVEVREATGEIVVIPFKHISVTQ